MPAWVGSGERSVVCPPEAAHFSMKKLFLRRVVSCCLVFILKFDMCMCANKSSMSYTCAMCIYVHTYMYIHVHCILYIHVHVRMCICMCIVLACRTHELRSQYRHSEQLTVSAMSRFTAVVSSFRFHNSSVVQFSPQFHEHYFAACFDSGSLQVSSVHNMY